MLSVDQDFLFMATTRRATAQPRRGASYYPARRVSPSAPIRQRTSEWRKVKKTAVGQAVLRNRLALNAFKASRFTPLGRVIGIVDELNRVYNFSTHIGAAPNSPYEKVQDCGRVPNRFWPSTQISCLNSQLSSLGFENPAATTTLQQQPGFGVKQNYTAQFRDETTFFGVPRTRHRTAGHFRITPNGKKATTFQPASSVPALAFPINPNFMRLLKVGPPQPMATEQAQPLLGTSPQRIDFKVGSIHKSTNVRNRPPPKGSKEKKFLSRSARIGIAIFKAFDRVSEAAEVVDSFFEALPQDIQDQYTKAHKKRGLADTAGQFGLGGADWKLQALYKHWDKVNIPNALINVLFNEFEDQIIGKKAAQLQKLGVRNAQPIIDREFGKWLNDVTGAGASVTKEWVAQWKAQPHN